MMEVAMSTTITSPASTTQTFFGKYRGKAESNLDPLLLGRLQVSVPAVLGADRKSWAMPCTPYAGPGVGFFALPPVGANVWVEFEGGDPDYPIWSGCFWGNGEVPVKPAVAEIKMFKTESIAIIMNNHLDGGGLTIEVLPPVTPMPLKIVLDAQGIELAGAPSILRLGSTEIVQHLGAASIALSPVKVSINNGALEVL